MDFLKMKTLAMAFCLFSSFHGFAALQNPLKESQYTEPTQKNSENLFQELLARSNDPHEIFPRILSYFEEHKNRSFQFQFAFPLKDEEEAKAFIKTLYIKSQEAHRFVPPIADSHFVSPRHLGFLREIHIAGNGPYVRERVLTDPDSPSIIFIEESVTLPSGKTVEGSFAALNQVIENNGQWYFTGTYLYGEEPSSSDVERRMGMFRKTYENMLSFIENEDVEAAYGQLQSY